MIDIALGVARAGLVQAAVLTLLLLALVARIVVQLVAASERQMALRILDVLAAPLLAAFLIILVQRFWELS